MLIRLPIAIFVAGLLTFGLYFGMQLLILSGESAQTEDLSFKIVDTRIPPRETEVQRKEQQIERPEKIEAPEPPKIDIARSSVSNGSGVNMDFKFSGGVDVGGGINFNAVDRDAQPIYRQEPEFQNIRKPEFIVLEFDVRPDGSVAEDTIQVLQTSSTRLQRPAIRAVKKWKYQGKVINGENVWQYGVRVQFTIQPPE